MCGKTVFIVLQYIVLRFPQKIKLDSWGERFFVDFIFFKKDLFKRKACYQSDALHHHLGYVFGNMYVIQHVSKKETEKQKRRIKASNVRKKKTDSIHIRPLFFASIYI